jgi:hypothetical protein
MDRTHQQVEEKEERERQNERNAKRRKPQEKEEKEKRERRKQEDDDKIELIIYYKNYNISYNKMAFSTELLCFSYACSTQNPEMIEKLKHSNKILLPESLLFELTKDNHDSLENKLYFKVSNVETQYGEVCGVHEFSSPPGVVHLPYHIMNSCAIAEGTNVKIELVAPPKGDFVKLRLHNSKEFSKLSDPKAVLEKIMSRDYPVVTQGQTIALHYQELDKVFMIDIVEARPAEIIEILNADINVDFDKAVDYEEPKPEPESKEAWTEARDVSANLANYKMKTTYDMERFPGKGNRLGSS